MNARRPGNLKHARWYPTTARLEARPGGTIDYVSGPSRFHVTGRVLVWEPPRVFEHEWNVEPRRELPHGEQSVVRWELTPEGDGTILRVTHRRLTRGTANGFVSGLHVFLERLEDELDGKPLGTGWPGSTKSVRSTGHRGRDDPVVGVGLRQSALRPSWRNAAAA